MSGASEAKAAENTVERCFNRLTLYFQCHNHMVKQDSFLVVNHFLSFASFRKGKMTPETLGSHNLPR